MGEPVGRAYIYWTVFLLCLVPNVTANHPEAGDYTHSSINYFIAQNGTTTQNVATDTVLMSFTFTDAPLNDFTVTNHTLIFHISTTGIYRADSDGAWLIQTDLDGTVLNDCTFRIETFDSGFLGADLPIVPHHSPSCNVDFSGDGVNGGTHTVNVTALIDSGSPATLENYNTHVEIIRQDEYMIPQEITLVPFDFWLPLLFWLGILAFALYIDSLWIAGFSIPGLFNILLPDVVPFEQTPYYLFIVLGFVLEYFAYRKRLKEGALTT